MSSNAIIYGALALPLVPLYLGAAVLMGKAIKASRRAAYAIDAYYDVLASQAVPTETTQICGGCGHTIIEGSEPCDPRTCVNYKVVRVAFSGWDEK